jgi:hypothetical protein
MNEFKDEKVKKVNELELHRESYNPGLSSSLLQ